MIDLEKIEHDISVAKSPNVTRWLLPIDTIEQMLALIRKQEVALKERQELVAAQVRTIDELTETIERLRNTIAGMQSRMGKLVAEKVDAEARAFALADLHVTNVAAQAAAADTTAAPAAAVVTVDTPKLDKTYYACDLSPETVVVILHDAKAHAAQAVAQAVEEATQHMVPLSADGRSVFLDGFGLLDIAYPSAPQQHAQAAQPTKQYGLAAYAQANADSRATGNAQAALSDDLQKLKALAMAAMQGQWQMIDQGGQFGLRVYSGFQGFFNKQRPNVKCTVEVINTCKFIEAADPQTVLALIERIEASQQPAAAPSAPATAIDAIRQWDSLPDAGRAPAIYDGIAAHKAGIWNCNIPNRFIASLPLPVYAPPTPPQEAAARDDHDNAVRLLGLVFDAWENGDDCYEDPENCACYLGKAFQLDDEVFKECCDLLNRLNPPRNAAPAAQAAVPEGVLEAAINWWEGLRPVNWSEADHLTQPAVNASTGRGAKLALAVAAHVAAPAPVLPAAGGDVLSAIEPDNVLLDFLDTNLKMTMGWRVGIAPAGNVSIQSIIASKTTIREAIHEAIAIKHASALRALNKQEPTA